MSLYVAIYLGLRFHETRPLTHKGAANVAKHACMGHLHAMGFSEGEVGWALTALQIEIDEVAHCSREQVRGMGIV